MLNIFDILRKEHQELSALVNELISLENKDNYRVTLVDQIQREYKGHKFAEEITFYNTIKLLDADRDLIGESFKEHTQIDQALMMLIKKIGIENQWKNLALDFKELVENHIEEEENVLFTEAVTILSSEEAVALGDAFLKMKARALQGYGINSEMAMELMPERIVERYNMTH